MKPKPVAPDTPLLNAPPESAVIGVDIPPLPGGGSWRFADGNWISNDQPASDDPAGVPQTEEVSQ